MIAVFVQLDNVEGGPKLSENIVALRAIGATKTTSAAGRYRAAPLMIDLALESERAVRRVIFLLLIIQLIRLDPFAACHSAAMLPSRSENIAAFPCQRHVLRNRQERRSYFSANRFENSGIRAVSRA